MGCLEGRPAVAYVGRPAQSTLVVVREISRVPNTFKTKSGSRRSCQGRRPDTAKSFYVAFETPEDLINPIYEAIREGVASGKVKKGTNEVTKSVERTTAKLVVIAEDVDPPEVVAHLPLICDEHHTPYAFVPSQQELGKALGLETKSAAAAILDAGDAKHIVDQVIESLAAVRSDGQ